VWDRIHKSSYLAEISSFQTHATFDRLALSDFFCYRINVTYTVTMFWGPVLNLLHTFFVVWDPGWFFIELRVVPKGSTSLKTLNKIEKFVKPKELKVSFSLIFTIFSLEFIFLSMAQLCVFLTIKIHLMPTNVLQLLSKKNLWLKFTYYLFWYSTCCFLQAFF